ncbi:MAG: 3'3'-cGAMP-specific phosphodiesterase [Terriglobales bacterium]
MLKSETTSIRFSDLVSALSVALDLTEGQPIGHAVRSTILGMRIAKDLKLPAQDCSDLYYALLLKDAGCSANSARMYQILESDEIQAKREIKFEDWTKPSLSGLRYLLRNTLAGAPLTRRLVKVIELGVQQKRNNAALIGARCERGAEIAHKLGLSEATAEAIRSLDEHWNGGGYPEHRKGAEISMLARIINVSQTLEVFATTYGSNEAVDAVCHRSGTWFDPEIVRVVRGFRHDTELWQQIKSNEVREHVMQMEPGAAIPASSEGIDSICNAFAEVIDAKSPYTFNHSLGVTEAAVAIATGLGLAPNTITLVRRASLLHDIGKLSVSNSILEKPGKLTDSEWKIVKMHPIYTREILKQISGFENLAFIAAAHHERLDGTGYPNGLSLEQLPLTARIICVADVFQALSEKRPYRDSLPTEVVFSMMERDLPKRLDSECFAELRKGVLNKSEGNAKAHSAGK